MATFVKYAMTGVVLLTLAIATPELAEASPGQKGIVGAWVIEGQPDGGGPGFINIGAIHRDGTMSNADPLFGAGHGVWKRSGRRSFAVRFVTIVSPFNAILPNTIITVNGNLYLDKSRKLVTGDFETTFTDLDGNPVMPVSTGTIKLTRITTD
ncbi:MAG: hypothetical protein AAFN50_12890 [Pseudomonadota bacterium]